MRPAPSGGAGASLARTRRYAAHQSARCLVALLLVAPAGSMSASAVRRLTPGLELRGVHFLTPFRKDGDGGQLEEPTVTTTLKTRKPGQLSSYMRGLTADVLAERIIPESASKEIVSARCVDGNVLLLTPQPVHLGPRCLGLSFQPELVLWLQRQRNKQAIVAVSECCGSSGFDGLKLGRLHVSTTCRWIEDALDHSTNACVPCLVWSSQVALELDRAVRGARGFWLRWLVPTFLLEKMCKRAVGKVLRKVQSDVAQALLVDFEKMQFGGLGSAEPGAARLSPA